MAVAVALVDSVQAPVWLSQQEPTTRSPSVLAGLEADRTLAVTVPTRCSAPSHLRAVAVAVEQAKTADLVVAGATTTLPVAQVTRHL